MRVKRLRAPRFLVPVVVLGVVAFLYVRPIGSYLETRDQLAERRAEVAALRVDRNRAAARLERATSLDELARAARRIGYVRPGEHLFIVKGTAEWKRSTPTKALTPSVTGAPVRVYVATAVDDRAAVAAQLGREPRTFRRVAVRCPWGLPAVTEQEPYGARRRAVPDDVLPDLPPPRRRRVAARGSGRGRALERGGRRATPRFATSLERATAEQVRDPTRARGRRDGADDGASLELGIGGSRNPAALKCLHAHVAFALARPGYRLGELVLAELPERWPSTLLHAPRRRRDDRRERPARSGPTGRATVRRGARDAARADALHRQRDAVLEELHRRVGGVFTLAELADVYDGRRALAPSRRRRACALGRLGADARRRERRRVLRLQPRRAGLRAVSGRGRSLDEHRSSRRGPGARRLAGARG